MLFTKWILPEGNPKNSALIRREYGVPAMVADILAARGLSAAATSELLEEEIGLEDPFLLPDMQEKHIRMDISGGDFSVPIPYTHLHNLLSNLMQNAVKYNVEGGSVWVRLETDDRHLYLSVKDTGIGIPPEMKARVFERFFRVDKGRSRNVGGTGLGLAIVKHLANLYTGSVQLDSELGKGSLFRVTLIYPKEGKK